MEAMVEEKELLGINGKHHDTNYITIFVRSGRANAETECIHITRPTPEETLDDARAWLKLNGFIAPDEGRCKGNQELWQKTAGHITYVAEIVTRNHLLF